MTKPKAPPWSDVENETILRLRDGERRRFEDVAADLPGRTVAAIKLQYYSGLRDRSLVGQGELLKAGRPRGSRDTRRRSNARAPAPDATPAPDVALAAPPSDPRRSPAVAAYDAELRARIALQGATAGLLGDPLPGRSALDDRNRRLQGRGDGGANG